MSATDATVLGDLLARERRSDATALVDRSSGRTYDYRRFCTNAWKVGNFLTHLGVRGGRTVGVAADPAPEPVLTCFGAAMLGAVVEFDPSADTDARAVVVPTPTADGYGASPRTKLVVYGTEPESPDVSYFERDVWSENPTQPPDLVDPDDPVLAAADETYTHADVLAAARGAVERLDLTVDDRVAVRASLTDPGTVAAGLVAPLLVGAAILLPDEGDEGTAAVAADPKGVPESRAVTPSSVL